MFYRCGVILIVIVYSAGFKSERLQRAIHSENIIQTTSICFSGHSWISLEMFDGCGKKLLFV